MNAIVFGEMGEKSEDYCFLGSSIIPKIIFFNEWDKNAGAFTNLLFVIKTRNLNVNPLEFNFSESCSLLVHSMLPNCRFRLDRKKKYCPIPDAASERVYDADEHFKYSDYRADGIGQYFFFRQYEIYK